MFKNTTAILEIPSKKLIEYAKSLTKMQKCWKFQGTGIDTDLECNISVGDRFYLWSYPLSIVTDVKMQILTNHYVRKYESERGFKVPNYFFEMTIAHNIGENNPVQPIVTANPFLSMCYFIPTAEQALNLYWLNILTREEYFKYIKLCLEK